jgi:hypothetical protein
MLAPWLGQARKEVIPNMIVILVVTVICLCVLYLCYRAWPMGRGALLGLAAVITALDGLVTALLHLAL